jgi:hypothetical protein
MRRRDAIEHPQKPGDHGDENRPYHDRKETYLLLMCGRLALAAHELKIISEVNFSIENP